ncbi:PEP/pyruvate-binding domain-containing protein [Ideonella sp. BN130291]|uniref:PEP/pyruvate-binding domain-containing protein n=1 Tax=Ideonella sp. BN130291 TaxID=3112940 RepID=UPI002E270FA1|nr:PEP/pyruvate-binding domain-containing protein [Ideonella sp. BN130291]
MTVLFRLLLAAACGLPAAAAAQLAEKPSVFSAQRRGAAMVPASRGVRQPAFAEQVRSRAEFERMARVYNPGTERAIVHTLFVIDRARANRLYIVNGQRYGLHEDFLRAQYLAPNLDHSTLAGYYTRPERRFVLGTLGWQPDLRQWTFEFWEGDQTTPQILQLVQDTLAPRFFAPLVFKANSAQQESVALSAAVPAITEAQLLAGRSFLPLNTGSTTGRLRLVADIDSDTEDDIEPTDIVVLREVPLSIPPVAGVLTEKPSTVLSHVNLLVKGWGIPNAYVKDASARLQGLEGQWVTLKVTDTGYSVEPAVRQAGPAPRGAPRSAVLRQPDLATTGLLPLAALRAGSTSACGSKAARLGVIDAARRAGRLTGVAPVPDGYCIPFAHYAAFMRQPVVTQRIAAALATDRFERSRAVRRQALEQLRQDLLALPVDSAAAAAWAAQWQQQLGGAGVFVRSSSNSEDLARFSGAGLYSTVPNVTRAEDIAQAVKTVWASVFNFEAFEARRQAGIGWDQVVMGVFVQRAVDSVSSGVMVTRDPFDATHRGAVVVSAKRGIGIKVVEGRRVAEQSMFDARSGAVRRLSRSGEDAELKLDGAGGVVERAVAPGHDVLSEAAVRSLAGVGLQLKSLLGGVDQDIEWAIDGAGRVVLLQARPYIERKVL